ncbi:predicted protein [Sclerotinia sclerotiorum 1980 UF-70]|uniref:Uncharacterized protein n=2 Tax=Sclerotinia sclerotiorum (strain ATCC 18683 / 1980 / Ss-1) TaxID=665079 RepID=A7EW32_SCLS1|nr:predicted protein [Sclerotinia sclerotiorum 1980 UF-70]APA15647.1 hypothetical protein sscle_15g104170 [Sclerotinia sclerotiorum 1980 UF-70]EDN93674.1 predicted protein [Sclerotinia sclerotiorum 1980 UF-70]
MTLLLNLPPELFQMILLQAVLVRSPTRALRLRLVCKQFSQQVQFVLFQRQLLDEGLLGSMTRLEWNHCERAKFWHSYFVQRTLNTENRSHLNSHVISRMRMIAERICEETGIDLKTTIEALCWPAMYQAHHFSDAIRESGRLSYNLERDLLSAAAYLNLVPVTRRLLQADDCFEDGNTTFFPSPIILATVAGNTHILELFRDYIHQHSPESKGVDNSVTRRIWNRGMIDSIEQQFIEGAAMLDDTKLLRSTIYPTNGTRITGPMDLSTFKGILCGKDRAHSVEVNEYLGDLLGEKASVHSSASMLGKHARIGNIKMVRFLLDSGIDIRGISSCVPLVEACRGGQEKIVDLLLERGAEPDFPLNITASELRSWEHRLGHAPISYHKETFHSAMGMAAKAGSLSIVQRLINHGARLNHPMKGDIALRYAVTYEYTEIVRFLLGSGVISLYARRCSLKYATDKGLESMVELLKCDLADFEAKRVVKDSKTS